MRKGYAEEGREEDDDDERGKRGEGRVQMEEGRGKREGGRGTRDERCLKPAKTTDNSRGVEDHVLYCTVPYCTNEMDQCGQWAVGSGQWAGGGDKEDR